MVERYTRSVRFEDSLKLVFAVATYLQLEQIRTHR